MASGKGREDTSFVGAAAEITVYLPFVPTKVELYSITGGAAIEVGIKYAAMSGAVYYSTSTGSDSGVTINSNGTLTIANGADINVAGVTTYISAYE